MLAVAVATIFGAAVLVTVPDVFGSGPIQCGVERAKQYYLRVWFVRYGNYQDTAGGPRPSETVGK
jgi:hypothetical protein